MTENRRTNRMDRRSFLQNSSGIALFIGVSGLLPQIYSCSDPAAINAKLESEVITAWVRMAKNGIITILNPAAEMGQGSMTSLPVIFAEEMDADWSDVRVEFSPQESAIYGSEGWGPNRRIMLSAGSRVTKGYYAMLRKAGAQTRYILMHSAAKKWGVPIEEVETRPSQVIHSSSGQSLTYGDLVDILEIPDLIPEFALKDLKSNRDFRLIGRDMPRTDIPAKVDGSAQFAMDIFLPDMLYATIERGRVHGARPTLKNADDIKSLPEVHEVVALDHGIGILATSMVAALEARKQLDIEWSKATASGFNSEAALDSYEGLASRGPSGRVVTEIGDVRKAMRTANQTFEADFKNDYVYHAQMEPLNAVVRLSEDGQSAEAWVGSQQGFDSKLGIPDALGIPPENVTIHLQYLGGGFGRRSMTDFVTETALLAKAVMPKPVKLIWTREDDLTYGAFRPMSLQRLKVGVDANGEVTAFSHILVGDGDNLIASGIKNAFYDIPHQYAEHRAVPHGIRLKHWRAVGHGPNKFAIEGMLDEVARKLQIDPAVMRRKLMRKAPRALATLEEAIAMSDWFNSSPAGRAKGMAFLERSGTLSTGVCEISLDESTGQIKVHHFWSAHDAGTVIQPDNVKAQIEGGIIMGMSSVLKERLSIADGRVEQSNFHDYPLLRMEDIPDSIETSIIPSDALPEGVGESGTPLVACCIANAFLALTGKPLRHLPFTPERVLSVLAG